MTRLVAVDVGGTHARFAVAELKDGKVASLGPETTYRTADYASFERAWSHYAASLGADAPRNAAIAIAAPVRGDAIKLTNSPWIFHPKSLASEINVERLTLVNDFGAVGHAVAAAHGDWFRHLSGPDQPLPDTGVISVVGPGTGLGVAHVLRRDGRGFVTETEGGHIDFAPIDSIDDAILSLVRRRHRRASAERVVSGPGLATIYEVLAGQEQAPAAYRDDPALWKAALDGSDRLAAAAFARFCLSLGSLAGDIALAQGAVAVVIAGGLGQRIADHLPGSGFGARFVAKGRFEAMMASLPVKLITHPQPGLFGAAAAFAHDHG